jgi:hypothetical protein
MRVELSGQQFVFPDLCACCAGPPGGTALPVSLSRTTGKRVTHTKTRAFDVPCCQQCVAHTEVFNSANGLALGTLVACVIVACIAGASTRAVVGFILIVAGFVASRMVAHKTRERAQAMCAPTCVSPGSAAALLAWHGTVFAFELASNAYALEFMLANQKKLVNRSAEASALLTSATGAPRPAAPQAPRRYES